MGNVYITNYSIKLISRSLADSLRNKKYNRAFYIDRLSQNIDKELLDFCNDRELKEMYEQKNILKDFNKLIEDIENSQNMLSNYIENHNKQYAYDIKAPSFHAKQECQWLSSNFNNIEIPDIIKENHTKMEEFKVWIKSHRNTPLEELNKRFQAKFATDTTLKSVDYQNSGILDINNISVMSNLKQSMHTFFENEKIKKIRYAPLHSLDKIIKKTQDKEIEQFRNAKKKIMEIIFKIHQEEYNNIDLSFDRSVLEHIGFKPCKGCTTHQEEIPF